MAENNELLAVAKISSEVEESQVKIILSSQCIKAQTFLADRLKKESARQKQLCKFIKSGNLVLETEIKHAEEEIKSLMIAHETIKSANVELKKEWLLAKDRKAETVERIKNGEKKYEDLWLQCKNRYESITFVQKWLQATTKAQSLQDKIETLKNQTNILANEVATKKREVKITDRNRIIELAEYLTHEMPEKNRMIHKKRVEAKYLTNEIENIIKEKEATTVRNKPPLSVNDFSVSKERNDTIDEEWSNLAKNINADTLAVPKFQLTNVNLDMLSVKLNQIKKGDLTLAIETKNIEQQSSTIEKNKQGRHYGYGQENMFFISSYFNRPSLSVDEPNKDEQDNGRDYSKRKLINILEDVKIDKNDAYNIVSKVNPHELHGVDSIGGIATAFSKKPMDHVDDEQIEEIDLTRSNEDNILVPPTQYLDLSQEITTTKTQQIVEVMVHKPMDDMPIQNIQLSQSKVSQESKKRATFDLPLTEDKIENETENYNQTQEVHGPSPSENSQTDFTALTDERFAKMRDTIMKKHNLDLSPQFVYTKNILVPTTSESKIVKSKFFQESDTSIFDNNKSDSNKDKNKNSGSSDRQVEIPECNMEVDNNVTEIESPIDNNDSSVNEKDKTGQAEISNKTVAGLLFSHGPQGLPDSLDMSISTTGYEEGDMEFPHCIDSSLLLSPKADLNIPMSIDKGKITSQEVPNFLTGLRKTGLSFFTSFTSKSDTNEANQDNFTFNFGGEDKKSRGGLFSMFR